MLRRFLIKMFVILFGATAALLIADSVLFAYGTFDGPSLVWSRATAWDLQWWIERVGTTPNPGVTEIEQPCVLPARAGTWFHRNGGKGGAYSPTWDTIPHQGIIAYDIQAANPKKFPMVRGRALASEFQSAYRMGVALPFVMFERSTACPMHDDHLPTHPCEGGWQTRFMPLGFAANLFLLAAVLAVPAYLRDAIGISRMWRGRCARCAHILLPTQARCPECGTARLAGDLC